MSPREKVFRFIEQVSEPFHIQSAMIACKLSYNSTKAVLHELAMNGILVHTSAKGTYQKVVAHPPNKDPLGQYATTRGKDGPEYDHLVGNTGRVRRTKDLMNWTVLLITEDEVPAAEEPKPTASDIGYAVCKERERCMSMVWRHRDKFSSTLAALVFMTVLEHPADAV